MPAQPSRLAVGIFTALSVALALVSSASARPCAGAELAPTPARRALARHATLCLVNHERAIRGLRRLRDERHLDAAAQAHAQDMARRRYFAHTTVDGRTFVERILRAGYLRGCAGYAVGENIGWGTGRLSTPTAIVAAWMHSPEHRANILNPGFDQVGTGIAAATPIREPGATYTQDFGRRL